MVKPVRPSTIGIDIRESKSQIETALAEKTYFIEPTPRELTPAGRNFFSLSGGSSSGEYRQHLMRKEVDHGDHVLAIPAILVLHKNNVFVGSDPSVRFLDHVEADGGLSHGFVTRDIGPARQWHHPERNWGSAASWFQTRAVVDGF